MNLHVGPQLGSGEDGNVGQFVGDEISHGRTAALAPYQERRKPIIAGGVSKLLPYRRHNFVLGLLVQSLSFEGIFVRKPCPPGRNLPASVLKLLVDLDDGHLGPDGRSSAELMGQPVP
jgi:hypothetical protein